MSETSVSLLERLRRAPEPAAWQRLLDLYDPLIRRWLARSPLQPADRDDLVQEVLGVVVRKLPEFERRRTGAFRAWLRGVTVNCLRDFFRASRRRPVAPGDSAFLDRLAELEDPQSALSQLWDAEHDRHVVRRLLELIEPQFEAPTVAAFRLAVLEGRKAADVAAALGLTVNAVLLAKSRVLRRLRQELDGLLS